MIAPRFVARCANGCRISVSGFEPAIGSNRLVSGFQLGPPHHSVGDGHPITGKAHHAGRRNRRRQQLAAVDAALQAFEADDAIVPICPMTESFFRSSTLSRSRSIKPRLTVYGPWRARRPAPLGCRRRGCRCSAFGRDHRLRVADFPLNSRIVLRQGPQPCQKFEPSPRRAEAIRRRDKADHPAARFGGIGHRRGASMRRSIWAARSGPISAAESAVVTWSISPSRQPAINQIGKCDVRRVRVDPADPDFGVNKRRGGPSAALCASCAG